MFVCPSAKTSDFRRGTVFIPRCLLFWDRKVKRHSCSFLRDKNVFRLSVLFYGLQVVPILNANFLPYSKHGMYSPS